MKHNRIKLFVIGAMFAPMIAIAFLSMNTVRAVPVAAKDAPAIRAQDDVAAQYKKTCAVCHAPDAKKYFEPSKMDEVHVEIVLKGKKAEKPPHMPAYEPKGMTQEQAKLLVAYMRQMRTPPSK